MAHPYTEEIEVVNGVKTSQDCTHFVVYVHKRKQNPQIVGTCNLEENCEEMVKRFGKYELKRIKKTLDPEWSEIESKYTEDNTYQVIVTKKGRLYNGSPKVYSTVYYEEVPRLWLSKYKYDPKADGDQVMNFIDETKESK